MNKEYATGHKVQNPALYAILIWRFCYTFQRNAEDYGVELPYIFLVLPMSLNSKCVKYIMSTHAGLNKFAEKIGTTREEKLAIHSRALEMRDLTFRSIDIAIRRELIVLDYRNGVVIAKGGKLPSVPERIVDNIKSAERLGKWMSKMSLSEIASALEVRF
jgi:hypothetical protein